MYTTTMTPLEGVIVVVYIEYDDNDSFQWSVTLDDSYQLKDLLDSAESTDAFLETLQKIRQEHIEQYQ